MAKALLTVLTAIVVMAGCDNADFGTSGESLKGGSKDKSSGKDGSDVDSDNGANDAGDGGQGDGVDQGDGDEDLGSAGDGAADAGGILEDDEIASVRSGGFTKIYITGAVNARNTVDPPCNAGDKQLFGIGACQYPPPVPDPAATCFGHRLVCGEAVNQKELVIESIVVQTDACPAETEEQAQFNVQPSPASTSVTLFHLCVKTVELSKMKKGSKYVSEFELMSGSDSACPDGKKLAGSWNDNTNNTGVSGAGNSNTVLLCQTLKEP